MEKEFAIEQKIIIGLIVSTEYLQEIRPLWNTKLLQSRMTRTMAGWCIKYFDEYKKAPFKDISNIYYAELRQGLDEDLAEEIEQDILPEMSHQYESEGKFNYQYLLDQSYIYLQERHLQTHGERLVELIEAGELHEAEKLASEYQPLSKDNGTDIDLSHPEVMVRVDRAFASAEAPVVKFPGPLGAFLNPHLTRGAFVAFMASEKRGKSFWLLEIAMRAARQKYKVAFFQAGDMTEEEQIVRTSVYLARKSEKEKYTGDMYIPQRDCLKHQLGVCSKKEREMNYGPFEDGQWNEEEIRNRINHESLEEAFEQFPDYVPCYNCFEYWKRPWGVPWLKKINVKSALEAEEAKREFDKFFVKTGRRFKLSSHPNGSLSVEKMMSILDVWERMDGFIPDVIVIDYADLLVPGVKTEFRHQQDSIWRALRGMSQSRRALVATATQADAKSYEQDRLNLGNFSEDKRKYAHVTAMYGLNQDTKGREKKMGLMYLNELVLRSDAFESSSGIYILQSLQTGRPFLGSYK